MNPPISESTTVRSPESGRSPAWQVLAIVLILLAGLAAGTAILRIKPSTAAATEEHEGGEEHEAHGAGETGGHGGADHVEMSAAKFKNTRLVVEEAAPAAIRTTMTLYGKVAANEEATAHVSPRFAGIVKNVRKRLGDAVSKGEVLAVVESNDSLRTYDVRSEIAGTITAKEVTLGELVNDQKSLFTVTDLSSVWVDLNVYREDFAQLRVGQKILLRASGAEAAPVESTISYVSPFGAENTQSMLARAVVANPDGALRPGLFIDARVVLSEEQAAVTVRAAALQTLEQKTVVFVQEGDRFEARPVEVGRRDAERVEILSGVSPGEKYAAADSFLLKAELGKEGAAHEH